MYELTDLTIYRTQLCVKIGKALKKSKIVYIGCHTGWGKSTVVLHYLEKAGLPHRYISAKDENFFKTLQAQKAKLLVLDDLYQVQDTDEINTLVEFIANSAHKFILISRTALPPYLKPFFITRQLQSFGMEDFVFSVEETEELIRLNGVRASRFLCEKITSDTRGWPVAINLCAHRLKTETYSECTMLTVKQDIFDYFDAILFRNWDTQLQEFLMDLSSFSHFGVKLVSMVTGKRNAEQALTHILAIGSFLQFLPPDDYTFFPPFQEYLQKKQQTLCTAVHIRQIYQNAGLYYELEDDLPHAMEYYSKAGNLDKLSALLIENSNQNASNAQFYETEPYYRSLPQDLIERSPELMSALSMLESLCCHPDESEKWYAALERYQNRLDKNSPSYKIAREKLLYLSIALPHRGSVQVLDLIRSASELCGGKLHLQEISVTGDMPSLMNGGKDFTEWSKRDKSIYTLLKAPVELIFGKCGVGLADAALGESILEKSKTLNFTNVLSHLNTALSQATLRGTAQMQFATLGIMARAFVDQGSLDTAESLIENFRTRCVSEREKPFLPNIDAMRARFAMLRGNCAEVKLWMEQDAPDELCTFYILSRYQYLTKVRGYLLAGRHLEAISLLNLLKIYYERYDRPYGIMETQMLYAIVLFRMKDQCWQEEITAVLQKCQVYGFTRLLADEGAAVFPLLNRLAYDGDKSYFDTVLSLTREQALHYPQYLEPEKRLKGELSPPELAVLQLIIQGKRNNEIADFLNISVSTVKFHTGNIYGKLNVNSRSQAIKVATELKLV
ncbi:MAG: hypothetical protein GXW99_09370 [Clostridiales bacterium]|nr:hypothetical protein [Clostridiales bacterium]